MKKRRNKIKRVQVRLGPPYVIKLNELGYMGHEIFTEVSLENAIQYNTRKAALRQAQYSQAHFDYSPIVLTYEEALLNENKSFYQTLDASR